MWGWDFFIYSSRGGLSTTFDVFQSTENIDKYFENFDVYDAFDKSKGAPVTTTDPIYKIDVGFDHKENLIKKASGLNFYKELRVGDGNFALPFHDGQFQTIFSNIIYWLDDPVATLRELRRILRPEGKICLMLPNKNLLNFSFYYDLYIKPGDINYKFLEMLDRGRLSENIRQVKSDKEWEDIFAACQLKILNKTPHLSKPIFQIWDIGLRPIFPLLLEMVYSIDSSKISEIKKMWIALFLKFLNPLIKLELECRKEDPHAFACSILQK